MSDKEKRELLCGYWLHSHEEDTETEQVFRPEDYDFPPSHGRRGFQLQPDGAMLQIGPGPTDLPQTRPGTWELTEGGTLILRPGAPSRQGQALRISTVDKDRLVVKKETS